MQEVRTLQSKNTNAKVDPEWKKITDYFIINNYNKFTFQGHFPFCLVMSIISDVLY